MKCIACKLEIEDGASKCVHCDTIQTWRRLFGVSGTILSLLVALISVSTVAVSVFKRTFSAPKPEPNFLFVVPASGQGQVVLSNTGEIPIIFSKATLFLGEPTDAMIIELIIDITANDRLLQPNSARVFDIIKGVALFSNEQDILGYLASGGPDCRQEVSFNKLDGNIIFLSGYIGCTSMPHFSF